MFFNEEVPDEQLSIDPTYLPQHVQWAAKFTGFKPTGEYNDWGKVQSYVPGWAIAQHQFGKTLGNQQVPGAERNQSDFYKNVMDQKDAAMARTKVGFNAILTGVGAYTGNPQLMQTGAKGLATNIPQTKGGPDFSDDWGTKMFQWGGEIDPPGLPITAQQKPMNRMKDPTWEDAQRIGYQNKLIRQQQTQGILINPSDPTVMSNGIFTDNPDYQSRSMLNMIFSPAPSPMVMPQRIEDPKMLKEGGVMNKSGLSGEDITMIDKWTGRKVGEVSYGERIMDKEANIRMKALASGKKYAALGKYVAQEMETQNDNEGMQWKKGGELTVDKAKMILRDGKIRGKALTDRQKKFFGFIAGGGKPDDYKHGGIIEIKPKSYDGGGNVDWTIPGSGDMSTPADRPAGMFEQLGGWEQLFNLGQFTTGMMGANDKLPEFHKSDAWTEYVRQAKRRSMYGMSNADQAMMERQQTQGLTAGLNFSRETSGGNSAFAVGDAQRFAGDFMDNTLKFASLNNKIKEDAISRYGNILLQDISFDRQGFDQKYKEAMLKKSTAAKLAQTGLQSAIDQIDYNKNYGKGSMYQNYLQSMIDLNRKLSNADYSGWVKNLPGKKAPGQMIGSVTGNAIDSTAPAAPVQPVVTPWDIPVDPNDPNMLLNLWTQPQ